MKHKRFDQSELAKVGHGPGMRTPYEEIVIKSDHHYQPPFPQTDYVASLC